MKLTGTRPIGNTVCQGITRDLVNDSPRLGVGMRSAVCALSSSSLVIGVVNGSARTVALPSSVHERWRISRDQQAEGVLLSLLSWANHPLASDRDG